MKWLTTILTLYLLGLSLWPCADEALPTNGQGSQVALTKAGMSNPGSSHEHHDQCSPFCTCACCAATITVITHVKYALANSVEIAPATVAAFLYEPIHWAEPLSPIWQPPKLRA